MKNGEFEVYLPGEEGYEDSMVEIKNYVEPKEEPVFVKPTPKLENEDEDDEDLEDEELDGDEEFDTEELMGASTVFDDDSGYSVEDAE